MDVEPVEGFSVTLSGLVNGAITTASTNGTILNDDFTSGCSITGITIGNQTSCVPVGNNYSQQVTVNYTNPPGTGSLIINGRSFPITSSTSQAETLTGLPADGQSVNVTAYFSAEPSCLCLRTNYSPHL